MITSIKKKVIELKRSLDKTEGHKKSVTRKIRIATTFGSAEALVKIVNDAIPYLLKTKSFSGRGGAGITFVNKTAPSIGSKLAVVKQIALQNQHGSTNKCLSPRCQCCSLVPNPPVSKVKVNRKVVRLPNGNCHSKNFIYLAICKLCKKP